MSSPALKVTVNVTQDDIDNGVRVCCHFCPIALAISRSFPGEEIYVTRHLVKIRRSNGLKTLIANLPLHATLFVSAFDDEAVVFPITLALAFEEATR